MLRGLWERDNPRPAATSARERLHVIGFVYEEAYADDEIREVTVLFANPHLAFDLESYPLRWPTVGASALRLTNQLWNSG